MGVKILHPSPSFLSLFCFPSVDIHAIIFPVSSTLTLSFSLAPSPHPFVLPLPAVAGIS